MPRMTKEIVTKEIVLGLLVWVIVCVVSQAESAAAEWKYFGRNPGDGGETVVDADSVRIERGVVRSVWRIIYAPPTAVPEAYRHPKGVAFDIRQYHELDCMGRQLTVTYMEGYGASGQRVFAYTRPQGTGRRSIDPPEPDWWGLLCEDKMTSAGKRAMPRPIEDIKKDLNLWDTLQRTLKPPLSQVR